MLARLKHFKVFLNDKDKKPLFKILKEACHFGILKKTLPTDYFRKFLYRKDITDYQNYLSLKEYYSIIESKKMVFPEISSILSNKLSFQQYFENHKIPMPKMLSFNLKTRWFLKGELKIIDSEANLLSFLNNLFESIPDEVIFLKPIMGQGGQGCLLLKKNDFKTELEPIYTALISNSYIHQEYIQQHELINAIFDKSVNTLRMDTYIDKNNQIHILSALMRFGVGKLYTDNAHTGGFYIEVNGDTGKLQGVGRQDIVHGGKQFVKHPNSKIVLNGYQVPYFKEACHLALKAAHCLPNRIIGWDIAITCEGPMLIEGNEKPSLHVTDVAYGGYLKNKYMKDILKEIKQ